MKKRLYIFVPGILSRPADSEGWTDRAVTWTQSRPPYYRAEKWEYLALVLTRRWHQQERARKLAKKISYYDEQQFDVILVGHSNGCDVISRALPLLTRSIDQIHFIAPAAHAEETIARLRDLHDTQMLYKFCCYIGGSDRWTRLAKRTIRILQWFGLGYGAMGAMNPCELELALQLAGIRSQIVFRGHYDHSTWFEDGEHFDTTMGMITA